MFQKRNIKFLNLTKKTKVFEFNKNNNQNVTS